MIKSVVLLSGGMDSTVNFLAVREQSQIVLAITFDYGQRAAEKEKEVASRMASHFQVPHCTLELPFFKKLGTSSLTDRTREIPTGESVSIDDLKISQQTAKSVWVPNRNGIFLNIAAGFAETLGASWIVPGFNKEEAATFHDNSQDYLEAATTSLSYSTSNKVQVRCLTTDLSKTEIVALGQKLHIDWKWIWPCYFNQSQWCGQCESCQRSKRALDANGVSTQDLYAN